MTRRSGTLANDQLKSCHSRKASTNHGYSHIRHRWVARGTGVAMLAVIALLVVGCAGRTPEGQGLPHTYAGDVALGEGDSGFQEITTPEQFSSALASPLKPLVAFFYLPGCGGCLLAKPVLKGLEAEFAGQAAFVQVHANNVLPVSREYGIVGTPMVLVFKDGEEIKRFVSLIPEEELRSVLRSAGAK